MPTAPVIENLAEALGVAPGTLFEEPVPLGEAPQAAQAKLAPGAPEPLSPQVREWLREHDAVFGAMSDEEFEKYVLRMDLELDSEGKPVALWDLYGQLRQEDVAVQQALNQEDSRGGPLFPKLEKGPDLVKRASERWRTIRRLREKLHRQYDSRQSGLMKYSARLYDEGETDDYLLPAHMAEAERRRLLQEAFTGADTA
jgi:hypothetical protein